MRQRIQALAVGRQQVERPGVALLHDATGRGGDRPRRLLRQLPSQVNQHESVDPLGVDRGQVERDHGPERVPDEVDGAESQPIAQGQQIAGMACDPIAL